MAKNSQKKFEETKRLADEISATQKKVAEQAKSSVIPSRMGKRKTITISKGTDQEYTLTLQFPGVERASQIRDGAMNVFNNISRTGLMQDAIEYIIVNPKIESLDFWNDHTGYDEVCNEVMTFLADMLN